LDGAAFWLTLTTAGGVPFYTGRLPVDGTALQGEPVETMSVATSVTSSASQPPRRRGTTPAGVGGRYFIAVGSARYSDPDLSDLPATGDSVAAMRALFADELQYQVVPGFDPGLPADAVFSLLGAFLSSSERRTDDVVALYLTGHATRADDDLTLLFPESRLG